MLTGVKIPDAASGISRMTPLREAFNRISYELEFEPTRRRVFSARIGKRYLKGLAAGQNVPDAGPDAKACLPGSLFEQRRATAKKWLETWPKLQIVPE